MKPTGIPIERLKVVSEMFLKLQVLNDEKINLEQTAHRLANEGGDVHINMHLAADCGDKQNSKPKADFDWLSIMERKFGLTSHSVNYQGYKNGVSENRPEPVIDMHEEVPDTVALQIIGVLIAHKNAQIKAIVDQLVEMGFQR